jgi:uncharacterized membrane protein YfhO
VHLREPGPVGQVAGVGGVEHHQVGHRPDRIVLSVQPSAPGWLVLADTHFPGWLAFVDGEPRPIRRANVAFRAVQLRAGDRSVEFRYEPWPVRAGLITSGIALGAVLLALAAGAAQRPRPNFRSR